MNTYLIDRLRCDIAHALARAEIESSITHQGVKGRFRELLVDNLLAPWLPPYVGCGSGLILGFGDTNFVSGQEDIVLYDRSLTPPILASTTAPEGVFLSNSVLARVEVKSRLDATGVRAFVQSSLRVAVIPVTVHKPTADSFTATFNLLFAFHSDANQGEPDFELRRLLSEMKAAGVDPVGGAISMICVADRGFWKIIEKGGRRVWGRLSARDPRDYASWFVACVSSSCFSSHAQRSGRDIRSGLEAGIGHYLDSPYDVVPEPY